MAQNIHTDADTGLLAVFGSISVSVTALAVLILVTMTALGLKSRTPNVGDIPVQTNDLGSFRPWSRLDWLLIGFLTLSYSVFALSNLGSYTPKTSWIPVSSGESVTIDFGEKRTISKINFYFGHGKGFYELSSSLDNETWRFVRFLHRKPPFQMHSLELDLEARYIRFDATRLSLPLTEIAFFETEDKPPVPIKAILAPGTTENTENPPSYAFDEQSKVEYFSHFKRDMYFDEIYFARTAYELLHGKEYYENTHPPLGKLIISIGIAFFGMNPFAWRIVGTLIGIAMVPLMFAFGKHLFKRRDLAFATSFLFTFDFMHFVQSRIATVDVYAVFFIILMFLFMYRFIMADMLRSSLRRLFTDLFLSGLFFALGVATKWITLFGGLGLATLFFFFVLAADLAVHDGSQSPGGRLPSGPASRRFAERCRSYRPDFPRPRPPLVALVLPNLHSDALVDLYAGLYAYRSGR